MSEQSQSRSGGDLEVRREAGSVAVPEASSYPVMDIFRAAQGEHVAQAGSDMVAYQGSSRELEVQNLQPSTEASNELVELPKNTSPDDERISLVVGGVTEKAERQSVLVSSEKEYDRGSAAKGGKFKKFLRNIVRHDMGREFLLLRGRTKARDTIRESHRLYDMDEAEWQNLSASSIQRVLDDREIGEMMDVNAGEQQKLLETGEGQALRSTIDQLVTDYVENYEGKYTTEEGKQSLQQEMRRQLAELAKNNPDMQGLLGAGEAYMSNIVDIAEQVRQRVDHEHGIDEVLKKVDIITARLDPGARTALRETKTTKAFDALAKIGGLNGTIIASAAAVAYGVAVVGGKAGLQYGAKVGLGIPILGSAIAGVISGFQEKSRLAHEHAQVQREEELGYKGAKETKRREALKGLLNNMSNATVLTEALKQHKKGEEGHEAYEVTEDNFDQLLLTAVGASARRDLSSEKERAFISYSGETEAENAAERRALFLETVRARSALRRHYESQGHANKNGIDFDEFYQTRQNAVQESLLRSASDKDEEYNEWSTRRAFIKGAMTTGVGMLVGLGVSEGAALVTDRIKGVTEAIAGSNFGAEAKTLLGYAFDHIKGQFHAMGIDIPPVGPPNFTDQKLPGGGNLHIDDKLNFSDNGGTVTVDGPNGLHIDGLQKDPNGTLTQAAQEKLKAANVEYSESMRHVKVPGGGVEHQKINTYAREHGTKVDRSWWDNNTATVYEGNPYVEQSLQLTKDAKGNFVYSIKINEDAIAFHGKESANFDSGKFKMAISLTKESQSTPVMMNMHRDGDTLKTIIKPGSPLYALFEEHKNGNIEFKGKYAEAAQMMGDKDHDGRIDIRSLATDTGPGSLKTIGVPTDSTKSVTDMTMYLKEPAKIIPLADLSDTGEPMTLFIYPPYRTGLREADDKEVARDGTPSPAPVPPAVGDGPLTKLDIQRPVEPIPPQSPPETPAPSTELELRPRQTDADHGSDQGLGAKDGRDNVRYVDFGHRDTDSAQRGWEQPEAERRRWQEANERLRREAEARVADTERIRKESERIAEEARRKVDGAVDALREAQARREQANASSPQQNGTSSAAQSRPKLNETPEQRKRRIDQEEGIRARRNGAPTPQEIQHISAYRDAVDDYARAARLLATARKDMAEAVAKGENNSETLRELQKRINLAASRRFEARRKLNRIHNGADSEANAQALAARNRRTPQNKAAA